ncbi:single-stranded-DNA-specific exonuclease RecJ [candidate division KSB3 bacterium]|uniref:Single-stranded-DNA-specific exonuclease RecJ n=1 Tax=candidate division KSB3 bacterium TaxID=2044937 RepID=A0A2G6EAV5_9BACT|nr:MAG: single-stranded-DNA-specific exonuclease RecJ [candidate division KSB3 bacterium]PIE30751.1 MAG: single-stranded-DNA-specific exonuclease RecJ [candidate division KSB3 bacterium]
MQLSLRKKIWQVRHTENSDSILEVLLANRQINNAEDFLEPDFETGLHNPFLMNEMQQAVDLLRRVRKDQQRLMIVGDYDADGITGTALLYETFRAIGIKQIMCRLPHRVHDGYGFQSHITKEAIRDKVDVIVTVDNGVSSLDAIAFAKEHGISVIVCDHHTIPETLPEADAILHPRREGEHYPFHELTGVGVAYKLAQALCPRLMASKDAERFLKWSLDLVAIGTVADCATVTGENRILIKYGLVVIEKTRRPGLRNMLNLCLGSHPSYDSALIGFRIAPRLNAAGRISSPDTSLKLLTTRDLAEAERMAHELQDLNAKRQEQTVQAVHQAKDFLQDDLLQEKILIARHRSWHPGIIGLIAGRLTEEFHRPSIIFHDGEDGTLVASARSTEHFNIIEAISRQKDLLLRFGGHSQAAGCSIARENYDTFCRRMKTLANASLSEEQLFPIVDIDCELAPEHMSLAVKQQIDRLEPYGIGNVRPVFLLRNVRVQRLHPVGRTGAHLQIWVESAQKTIKGIAFQQGGLAQELSQGDLVDIACHLQENNWNGTHSLEIEVVDIQQRSERSE